MWEQACELIAAGDAREISAVLANRFRTSERVVDAVLVVEGIRHQREAAALRNGLVNTLAIAQEAIAAVDEELSEVA